MLFTRDVSQASPLSKHIFCVFLHCWLVFREAPWENVPSIIQNLKLQNSKLQKGAKVAHFQFCSLMTLESAVECDILKNILSAQDVDRILNSSVQFKQTCSSTRCVTRTWPGCAKLSDTDLRYMRFVELKDGRVDVSLPADLAQQLVSIALPDGFDSSYRVAKFNLLINPPNERTQPWHQDNGGVAPDDYYTLLIPLTHSEGMGKTEVSTSCSEIVNEHTPDVRVGDGLLFSGCLWHRGTPNRSRNTAYTQSSHAFPTRSCSRVGKPKTFERERGR